MFDRYAHRLSYARTRRFEDAFALLDRNERAVLVDAHGGGDRASVDWNAEAAAIDSLGRALELVNFDRRKVAA